MSPTGVYRLGKGGPYRYNTLLQLSHPPPRRRIHQHTWIPSTAPMVVRQCLDPASSRSSLQSSTSTRITSAPIPGALYKPMYLSIASANGSMSGEGDARMSPGTFLLTSKLRKANGLNSHVRRIMGVLFIAEATAPRGLRVSRIHRLESMQ